MDAPAASKSRVSVNASSICLVTQSNAILVQDLYVIACCTQLHGNLRCGIAHERTQPVLLQHMASARALSALAVKSYSGGPHCQPMPPTLPSLQMAP